MSIEHNLWLPNHSCYTSDYFDRDKSQHCRLCSLLGRNCLGHSEVYCYTRPPDRISLYEMNPQRLMYKPIGRIPGKVHRTTMSKTCSTSLSPPLCPGSGRPLWQKSNQSYKLHIFCHFCTPSTGLQSDMCSYCTPSCRRQTTYRSILSL